MEFSFPETLRISAAIQGDLPILLFGDVSDTIQKVFSLKHAHKNLPLPLHVVYGADWLPSDYYSYTITVELLQLEDRISDLFFWSTQEHSSIGCWQAAPV